MRCPNERAKNYFDVFVQFRQIFCIALSSEQDMTYRQMLGSDLALRNASSQLPLE